MNCKEDAGNSAQFPCSALPFSKPILSVGVFFCLCAVLSWTVWLWPIKIQGGLTVFVLGKRFDFPFFLIKLVIGNCLPGAVAVIWTCFEGRDRFRSLLFTLTNWKVPLKWYALAVALPCGVALIALDGVLFYYGPQHSFPPTSEFLKTFLMTLPFGPLCEEIAWRGFALRRLESRYSALSSALLLGLYWAVWHMPLWALTLNLTPAERMPIFFTLSANLIAWSVVWTYLYNRSSQSLPVVILLHATYVAATNQVFPIVPNFQRQLVYVSAVLAFVLAATMAWFMRRRPRLNRLLG
jgi:membrane protease YdiL (CAAX protease family)